MPGAKAQCVPLFQIYGVEGQFYISYKAWDGLYIRNNEGSIITEFYKAQE